MSTADTPRPGRTLTGAGQLASSDHDTEVLLDPNGANRAVQMPTPSLLRAGWHCWIKKITADAWTYTLTQGAAEQIEGTAGTYTWALSGSANRPWLYITFDGTDFWVH